ncbi:MAG: radical SAM protein [bacterium]
MSEEKTRVLLIHVGPNSREYLFRSHPLGLMSLAAYAERELPGVDAGIIDMKVSNITAEEIGIKAKDAGADVVGLSALTVHADMLESAAAAVREAVPDALIVAGGPHATCHPLHALKSGYIDAVVQGEGERPFVNLLRARIERKPLQGIPAVMTPGMTEQPPRDEIENPDTLPFPAWDKIDFDAYSRYSSFSILGRRHYMSVFTSRACPYQCIYCHNIFGNKFRPRSADNVLREIRTLNEKYGIRDFDALDDAFNLNRARVVEICESLIKDGPKINIAFPNGLRSDLLDDELLELMRKAGTTYISFAIETASPRLQKYINKNLKIEKAARAIRKASQLGIFCNGYLMVGFPTETEEELRSTISFAIKSPLDTAHFLKVTPFAGTELFNRLDPETVASFKERPEIHIYEDRTFNLSKVPNEKFKKIVHSAFLKFYLNPMRALNIIRHHPAPMRLMHFARVAFMRVFIKG